MNKELIKDDRKACKIDACSLIKEFFKNNGKSSLKTEELILAIEESVIEETFISVSQSCLELFYLNNFCGPANNVNDITDLTLLPKDILDELDSLCQKKLSEVGEDIRPVTRFSFLLWISTQYLKSEALTVEQNFHQLLILILWSQIFHDPLSYFKDQAFIRINYLLSHIDDIKSKNIDEDINENRNSILLLCLETFLIFKDFEKSEELIDQISSELKIEVRLTGLPGKRTKFQLQDLAQPALDIKIKNEENHRSENICLPHNVILNDDTLLSNIQFSVKHSIPSLNKYHQYFLILICYYKINNLPITEESSEELLPYINVILESPTTYELARNALYFRSYYERKSHRKLERTISQLEDLSNTFTNPNEALKISNADIGRTAYWHLSLPLPFWKIKELLADTYYKMGCVKSAIDIYLELKSYDELLNCYMACGRREKATELILHEIEKIGKNSTLLCLLGQVNDEQKYFDEALQISDGKCFRAYYQLGYYYLKRKDFSQCIENFEKALKFNSIQPKAWYNLGCSYLEINNDDKAASAFRTCCHLEPNNFKSWTNLASVLIKQNKYDAAYHAVLNAISCDYNYYQIWVMYVHISMKLNRPNDVLRCFDRIVEANWKTDDKIVEYLTNVCLNQDNFKIRNFLNHLIESMVTLSKKTTLSYISWWMLAKLQYLSEKHQDSVNDSYNCALRALIYYSPDIEKYPKLLNEACTLIDDYIKYLSQNVKDSSFYERYLTSTGETIDSLQVRLRNYIKDLAEERTKQYESLINKFESLKLLTRV